jgi:ribosome biogenesis GTPase
MKFRIKGMLAVGVVDYELEESSDTVTGTIHNIERKNYIVRKSVNLSDAYYCI